MIRSLVCFLISNIHSSFKESSHLKSFLTKNENYIIDCIKKRMKIKIIESFIKYIRTKYKDLDSWSKNNEIDINVLFDERTKKIKKASKKDQIKPEDQQNKSIFSNKLISYLIGLTDNYFEEN